MSTHPPDPDLLDQLIQDWNIECPDLDTTGMGVVGRIIHLGGRLRSEGGAALDPYDLNYTDFDVLATLRRSGVPYALTPTVLMQSVLLTSGAMTATLKRLEGRELVTRDQDADDKRVKRVKLTPAGERLVNRAVRARFQQAQTAVARLSEEEREHLAGLLRKFGQGLI